MALPMFAAAAFDRPGGEGGKAPRSRPIDLTHLSRQTMGDRGVEQDVLRLFVNQAKLLREQICTVEVAERLRLAHALKGSARGVGAFAIGDCLEEIESRPADPVLLRKLKRLIDEANEFIASINR